MSTTVGQCPHCAAVINRHWTACLVCHATISPTAEPTVKSVAAPLPAIQPGSLVTWTRGDGTRPEGFVDFLHTDPDGKEWAFVSYGKTWAAIDRRLLTVVTL